MRIREPILNRRALISGRIADADPLVTPPGAEIASALVQVHPDRMAETEAAILELAGCEVYGRDPKGKLVVVIDAQSAGAIGSTLNAIALLPNVFSASLVFHATDAA
jgi:nitrate reductase NapD